MRLLLRFPSSSPCVVTVSLYDSMTRAEMVAALETAFEAARAAADAAPVAGSGDADEPVARTRRPRPPPLTGTPICVEDPTSGQVYSIAPGMCADLAAAAAAAGPSDGRAAASSTDPVEDDHSPSTGASGRDEGAWGADSRSVVYTMLCSSLALDRGDADAGRGAQSTPTRSEYDDDSYVYDDVEDSIELSGHSAPAGNRRRRRRRKGRTRVVYDMHGRPRPQTAGERKREQREQNEYHQTMQGHARPHSAYAAPMAVGSAAQRPQSASPSHMKSAHHGQQQQQQQGQGQGQEQKDKPAVGTQRMHMLGYRPPAEPGTGMGMSLRSRKLIDRQGTRVPIYERTSATTLEEINRKLEALGGPSGRKEKPQFSFKPQISRASRRMASNKRPIHERVLDEQRYQMERRKEAAVPKACTFKPEKYTKRDLVPGQARIQDRYDSIMKEKEAHRARLLERQMAVCTFAPTVSAKTVSLAQARRNANPNGGGLFVDLYEENMTAKRKIEERRKQQEDARKQDAAPMMSKRSVALMKRAGREPSSPRNRLAHASLLGPRSPRAQAAQAQIAADAGEEEEQ